MNPTLAYGEAPSPTHSSSDENEWDTGSHTWDEDTFYFDQTDGEDDFMNNDDQAFLPANQVDNSATSLTEVMQRTTSDEIMTNTAEAFTDEMQERAEIAIEETNFITDTNIEDTSSHDETKEHDLDNNEIIDHVDGDQPTQK